MYKDVEISNLLQITIKLLKLLIKTVIETEELADVKEHRDNGIEENII